MPSLENVFETVPVLFFRKLKQIFIPDKTAFGINWISVSLFFPVLNPFRDPKRNLGAPYKFTIDIIAMFLWLPLNYNIF